MYLVTSETETNITNPHQNNKINLCQPIGTHTEFSHKWTVDRQSGWSQEPYNMVPYSNHHRYEKKNNLNGYNISLLDQSCWEYFWIGNTDGQKFWSNSHRCPCSILQLDWPQVVPKSFNLYLSFSSQSLLAHGYNCWCLISSWKSIHISKKSILSLSVNYSPIYYFNFLSVVLTNIPEIWKSCRNLQASLSLLLITSN